MTGLFARLFYARPAAQVADQAAGDRPAVLQPERVRLHGKASAIAEARLSPGNGNEFTGGEA